MDSRHVTYLMMAESKYQNFSSYGNTKFYTNRRNTLINILATILRMRALYRSLMELSGPSLPKKCTN